MTGGAVGLAVLLLTGATSVLPAQAADLTRERSEYATWLATAPLSPYAAVAVQPVGAGLVLGPAEADIPLQGVPRTRVLEERGSVVVDDGKQRRILRQGTPMTLGGYRLVSAGGPHRAQLAVYGAPRDAHPPLYYPAAPSFAFTVTLDPPERRGVFRTLGFDGLETEATEAGFVTLPVPGGPARLRVYRMGSPDDDEAELQVFFRDSTNARGTYPAGRFVILDPAGGGRYRVDLNRSRNPFCAYNTVFACPAPWPGNSIPATITAGERYQPK